MGVQLCGARAKEKEREREREREREKRERKEREKREREKRERKERERQNQSNAIYPLCPRPRVQALHDRRYPVLGQAHQLVCKDFHLPLYVDVKLAALDDVFAWTILVPVAVDHRYARSVEWKCLAKVIHEGSFGRVHAHARDNKVILVERVVRRVVVDCGRACPREHMNVECCLVSCSTTKPISPSR